MTGRRLALLLLATVLVTAGTSCGGDDDTGDDPRPFLPTLSVVTVNIANADDPGGIRWQTRIDRLADAITAAQLVPDVISLTESAGLWNVNTPPFTRAGDYDMADRLIYDLKGRLGADYRIAYMTGVSGNVNNDLGTPLVWFYTGDTLLYNPDRLANLTPAEVAGKAQVGHANPLIGFQVRRSLPICLRGTSLMPLERLIDGPPQTDRCPGPTPSGPAYAQVEQNSGGAQTLVASLARFGFTAVPGSSFDVVTVHPQAGEEDAQAQPINDFIAALTGPRYRTGGAPFYPALVVGDYNKFANFAMFNWPSGTTQVFTADVMSVSLGSGVGLQPQHQLSVAFSATLPATSPCALSAAGSPPKANEPPAAFSDHCGLVVRFNGT